MHSKLSNGREARGRKASWVTAQGGRADAGFLRSLAVMHQMGRRGSQLRTPGQLAGGLFQDPGQQIRVAVSPGRLCVQPRPRRIQPPVSILRPDLP